MSRWIRVRGGAAAFAAVLVLAIADNTWAECAWVSRIEARVHTRSMTVTKDGLPLQEGDSYEWLIDAAFSSQRACQTAADIASKSAGDPAGRVLCLPDTVDPRGPTGK